MDAGSQRSNRQSVALVAVCAVLVLANLFCVFMIVNSLVTLARSQTEFVGAVLDRLEAPPRFRNQEAALFE